MSGTGSSRGSRVAGIGGGIFLPVLVAVLCGTGAVAVVHADDGGGGGDAGQVAALTRLLAELETRADRLEEQLGERDRRLREALLVERCGSFM